MIGITIKIKVQHLIAFASHPSHSHPVYPVHPIHTVHTVHAVYSPSLTPLQAAPPTAHAVVYVPCVLYVLFPILLPRRSPKGEVGSHSSQPSQTFARPACAPSVALAKEKALAKKKTGISDLFRQSPKRYFSSVLFALVVKTYSSSGHTHINKIRANPRNLCRLRQRNLAIPQYSIVHLILTPHFSPIRPKIPSTSPLPATPSFHFLEKVDSGVYFFYPKFPPQKFFQKKISP